MASYLRGIRSKLNNSQHLLKSSETFQRFKFPERLKGGIMEKWANYWKQLYFDYKEVALDVGREAKQKPLKTTFYGLLSGSTYLCVKNNPDETSFISQLRLYNSEMILVHESCHKKESAQHLKFLQQCLNAGLIRRLSLGVISFIWIDNYDETLALYKATCPYLKPKYLQFHDRIIDIGFWNKWWKLDEVMKDYDVNM